jgi:hypothetical protein
LKPSCLSGKGVQAGATMSRLIFWRKVTKSRANPPEPTVDEKATSPVQPPPDSPDLSEIIQGWVWKRFGWTGLIIVLACGVGWSQWDRIRKLPGIESLVARINEKSLPQADAAKFNIALVHLAGDDDHSIEQVIRTSLSDTFPIANTV